MKKGIAFLMICVLLFAICTAYADLSKGSKGDDVVALQKALIEQGYLNGSADGDYGKMTEAAVFAFQKAHGLKETGIADDATISAIMGLGLTMGIFKPYYYGDEIIISLQEDDSLVREYILDDNALLPANICQTISIVAKSGLSSTNGEYIASVTLENSILFITLHLPEEAATPLPFSLFVEGRIDNVTQALLEYPIIDMYCNTIVLPIEGHEGGYIFTRSDIDGNSLGRYMNYDRIIDQTSNIDKPFPTVIPNEPTEDYVKLNNEEPIAKDIIGSGLSVDTMELKYGNLLDVTENTIDNILVIKAKIGPSYSNKATIDQNYYNIEYLVNNYELSQFKEIQYWAVADMTDGSESKVISFTVPHSLVETIAGGRFATNTMGEYVEDLWVLPSLLR